MIPAVPLPAGSKIRRPVDLKLKEGWRFDAKRRLFVSDSGEEFKPWGDLPRKSRIVYKVPSLAEADVAGLSEAERALRRYMHVILPADESPEDYVQAVSAWPPVAGADLAPDVSLPGMF